MFQNQNWLKIIFIIAAFLFILFVWPTLYRYDYISQHGGRAPVRINRITGQAEKLSVVGWKKLVEEPAEEIIYDYPTPQLPMSSVQP